MFSHLRLWALSFGKCWIRAWVSMTLSSGNWRIVQTKRDPRRDHFVKEPNAAAECYTNNATCLSKYTSTVKYLNVRMRMYTRPSVMICIINSTYTLVHMHTRVRTPHIHTNTTHAQTYRSKSLTPKLDSYINSCCRRVANILQSRFHV